MANSYSTYGAYPIRQYTERNQLERERQAYTNGRGERDRLLREDIDTITMDPTRGSYSEFKEKMNRTHEREQQEAQSFMESRVDVRRSNIKLCIVDKVSYVKDPVDILVVSDVLKELVGPSLLSSSRYVMDIEAVSRCLDIMKRNVCDVSFIGERTEMVMPKLNMKRAIILLKNKLEGAAESGEYIFRPASMQIDYSLCFRNSNGRILGGGRDPEITFNAVDSYGGDLGGQRRVRRNVDNFNYTVDWNNLEDA